MTIEWTERQRPPVSLFERTMQSLLWKARLAGQDLAAASDFSGWRERVYRVIARAEERWSARVSQADMHLARCPRCDAMKMHVIMRPGETRWTNRKVCFGCQLDTHHPSEH